MTHKPGGFKLWAHIVVHGLQTVFAATTRRLEQVDQRLMQETAEKERPVSGSAGGPPAHWLSKVRGGGPPAHWLEDIRRRAANPDRLETFDVTVQSPEPERAPQPEAQPEDSQSARIPAEASVSKEGTRHEDAPAKAPASRVEARRKKAPAKASASRVEERGERKPVITSASKVGAGRGGKPVITSTSTVGARGEGTPVITSASGFGRFIQPIVAVRRAELPQAKAPEKPRTTLPPVAPVITARSQPAQADSRPDTARRDPAERQPLPWPALPDEPRQRPPIVELEHASPATGRGYVQEPRHADKPEPHMNRIPPGAVLSRGEHASAPRSAGNDLRPPAPNVWPELPPDHWQVVDDGAAVGREREHLQQLQREQEGGR